MGRPTKPCWPCGSNDWWLTPDGRYLCNRCHPNPNPSSNPGEEGHALEILALRDRVIKGNDKLFAAWQQIRELTGEERENQLDRWNEAQERLYYLCLELKAKGYNDCLYIENSKKTKSCLSNPSGFWCQTCPSSVPYWEQELMALPGPKVKKLKLKNQSL